MSLRKEALEALNRYFEECLPELRKELTPEVDLVRYRENFLAEFGPHPLAALSSQELMTAMPINAVRPDPMDYWLEFKNDEVFAQREFGSIAGGTAAKFGTWQEKETGKWRAKKPGTRALEAISDDEARAIVESRRTELLAAAAVLELFRKQGPGGRPPASMQSAIREAAPRWHESAWLHKYLHLCAPELVTWNATPAWAQAALNQVCVTPSSEGLYALDVQSVAFWSSLKPLESLPIWMRYRLDEWLKPRAWWGLLLGGMVQAQNEMLAFNCISLEPGAVEDLSDAFRLEGKREVKRAIERAFQDAHLPIDSGKVLALQDLGREVQEGHLVALLSDPSTVVAVGRVRGGYRYMAKEKRPHRREVEWLHRRSFDLPKPVDSNRPLVWLWGLEPNAAEIEASLLSGGIGAWPRYSEVVRPVQAHSVAQPTPVLEAAAASPLEPPEGLVAEVSAILQRKLQVILYGPPGTGKTWHAERVALDLVARHNFRCLPSMLSDQQKALLRGKTKAPPFIATCTFHPMYGYEDFIEGYRPDGEGFELKPGIFRRMVTAAQTQRDKLFVLIVDEINRGNIPKVFGELITLLEPSKRETSSTVLPLSGEMFSVPRNLFLIGTMNTADRSILLLDTALRRRFAFKELLPQPELLRGASVGDIPLSTWLRALNRRIVEQLGRDGRNLQVGHAYFMPDGQPLSSVVRLAEIVKDEIWPLLQEYCYEDPHKLSAILGGDKGVYDRTSANLRFDLFQPAKELALIQALGMVVSPEDTQTEAAIDETDEGDSPAEPEA